MAAIEHVEYVTLDGNRYAAKVDGFTRSHLPANLDQIKATRSESPFLDADVTSFGGGIKPDQMDDTADWIADAAGMEPYGAGTSPPYPLLRIGHALAETYSAAGSGELIPLAADHGYLYAGEQGGDSVLNSTDGITWTAVSTGAGYTDVLALLAVQTLLYAAGDNRYLYRSEDRGATWAQIADLHEIVMASGSGLTGATAASCSLLLVDATLDTSGGLYLYAVAEDYPLLAAPTVARGSVLCSLDSLTGTAGLHGLAQMPEPYCKAGVVHDGAFWLGTADTSDPVHGAIYTRTLQSADGSARDLTRVALLDGDYFTAAAAYAGATYWGTQSGAVYACDGEKLTLLRRLATAQPIRGMAVKDGALWVGVYGTSARLEVHRYDGTGWSQPHYTDATLTAAGQMVAFDGRLHVAAGNGTTRKVYAVSDTDYCPTARIILPDAVYGAPADAKRYRRVTLQHDALHAGQSVEALYSLDGASYVSLGTNTAVGSTRTAFELPEAAAGGRLSAWFSVTNDPTLTRTFYGGGVRALPAPDAREVWEAELFLAPQAGGAWDDAVADTPDAIQKFDALAALHDRCAVFEAVDPFRDADGMPRRVMLATFDLQTPFGARFGPQVVAGAGATIPVRLIQAASPSNLLSNASFELDSVGDEPTGWALSGTATTWQTEAPGDSAHGVRVLGIAYDGASANPSVYQGATVTPGRYYTLSGYIRRAGVTGASAAVYLRVSEAGVALAGAETTHLAAGSDSFFVRYAATFRVPDASSGTVAVECFAEGTPGGACYFDAIVLEPGAPASAFREKGT